MTTIAVIMYAHYQKITRECKMMISLELGEIEADYERNMAKSKVAHD